jgi:hypothetical protein
MLSRSIGVGLLAAGCLTAAAGGAFIAVRQNTASAPVIPATSAPAAPAVTTPATPSDARPVTETEAVVGSPAEKQPAESAQPATPRPRVIEPSERPAPAPFRRAVPAATRTNTPRPARNNERLPEERVAEPVHAAPQPAAAPVVAAPVEPAPRVDTPPAAAPVQFEELVLPAASVIGLEVETSISSERARIEDRIDARVTRDVYVDGRLVIPSHSRMIGGVTMVERGGKVKERARLGVRFHTLVLADGRQIAVRTETIVREGEAPSTESSRKIGGAAIGGAVLGAIMGGGKGAVLGGAAGAAGGTAAVMAGGRNAAVLPSGTVVTARLTTPVAIEVEKR